MNSAIDEYIDDQKTPQREICRELRKVILEAIPGVKEEMKMGVPWYEDKVYLVALRDHVNIGFSLKGLSQEMQLQLNGNGKTMKHLAIRSMHDINKEQIVKILTSVLS